MSERALRFRLVPDEYLSSAPVVGIGAEKSRPLLMDDCKRPRTIALEYRSLQNSDNYRH
jgi:hypothetical protein